MRNKKLLGALLAVTTLATFGLAGCGDSGSNGSASKEDDKTITVAASPTPHAEILNKAVKPLVEKDGYKLEVKEFTDFFVNSANTVANSLETIQNVCADSEKIPLVRAHLEFLYMEYSNWVKSKIVCLLALLHG